MFEGLTRLKQHRLEFWASRVGFAACQVVSILGTSSYYHLIMRIRANFNLVFVLVFNIHHSEETSAGGGRL
jgi:hypothetical protein